MADKSLGQAAYEAWIEAMHEDVIVGWKRLPSYERAAWEAAAAAAVEACGGSGG
jgi:hypothetical protein